MVLTEDDLLQYIAGERELSEAQHRKLAAAGYDADSCQHALDCAGGDVVRATRTMAASLLGPTAAVAAWPEDWESRDSQRR